SRGLPCVLLDEGQHLAPGIGGGVLVLLERAVEERMGRALIDHHLVGHAGVRELSVELGEILWRGGLVVTGEEQQEWRAHPRDGIAHPGRNAVKADRTRKSGLRRGLPAR